MARKLEERLCAQMAKRATLEEQMRALLENAARPGARRLLAHRVVQWLEEHERCNEAARALADSIEQERGAA